MVELRKIFQPCRRILLQLTGFDPEESRTLRHMRRQDHGDALCAGTKESVQVVLRNEPDRVRVEDETLQLRRRLQEELRHDLLRGFTLRQAGARERIARPAEVFLQGFPRALRGGTAICIEQCLGKRLLQDLPVLTHRQHLHHAGARAVGGSRRHDARTGNVEAPRDDEDLAVRSLVAGGVPLRQDPLRRILLRQIREHLRLCLQCLLRDADRAAYDLSAGPASGIEEMSPFIKGKRHGLIRAHALPEDAPVRAADT